MCTMDRSCRHGLHSTTLSKAKVEVAVQVVERWVLARLRHRRFFSLGELNAAVRELIDELNTRTMRRIGCSR